MDIAGKVKFHLENAQVGKAKEDFLIMIAKISML
jgi:hypothetical protein